MSILAWIEDQKRLKLLNAPKYVNPAEDSSKGLWTRCDKCGVILYIKHLKENQRVCFGCSYHLQMSSQERVDNLLDKHTWRALDETLSPCDPLEFHDQKDYTDRLQEAQERTGLQDAIQTGSGMIDNIPVALGVMDFDFMGGSMGSVVGEKVTRLIEYATQEGLTLLLVCASGGARMQEGVFSLMQMAKISSALQVYQECANLLYISILTSPTTGGVTASFAMLGDIIFAEPKALIAFAGRRVIEQTLCEDLPEDFQSSEYMLHHGLLDLIVPRRFLKQALSESIRLYRNAPFKKAGRIPFGVQNPISSLVEERIRRRWAVDELAIEKSFSDLWSKHQADQPRAQNAADRYADALQPGSDRSVPDNQTEQRQQELSIYTSNTHKEDILSSSKNQESALKEIPAARQNRNTADEQRTVTQSDNKHFDVRQSTSVSAETPRNNENSLSTTQPPKQRYRYALAERYADMSTHRQGRSRARGEARGEARSGVRSGSAAPAKSELSSLLPRETGDYRHILISFQTMFRLFSKQLLLPYSLRLNPNPQELTGTSERSKEGALPVSTQKHPYDVSTQLDPRDATASSTEHTAAWQQDNSLLAENTTARLRSGGDQANAAEQEELGVQTATGATDANSNVCSSNTLLSDFMNLSRDQSFNPFEQGLQQWQDKQPMHPAENTSPSFPGKGDNNTTSIAENKEIHNLSSICVDFLNQSIELAATESVEWRAFYIHQKVSKRTGFIEDFVRSSAEPRAGIEDEETASQNTLFYRAISRTTD